MNMFIANTGFVPPAAVAGAGSASNTAPIYIQPALQLPASDAPQTIVVVAPAASRDTFVPAAAAGVASFLACATCLLCT